MQVKKTLRAALTLALVGGLVSACSATAGDAEPEENIELRYLLWSSNPDQLALFDELADEFMEANPDVVKVTFETVTLADLNTVLPTQLSSNDPPDASWLPVENSKEYIAAEALVDLVPTLTSVEGYDFDDLKESFQARWRFGDAQYGVPFSNGPLIFYYNADSFAQAGLPDPSESVANGTWTWDLLREQLKTIQATTGQTGLVLDAFEFKNWPRLLPLIRAYGGDPFNADVDKCELTSDENVEAFQVLHDMIYVDGIMPRPGQAADFWGGGAASTIAYLSSNSLLADVDFNYGVVQTPSGPGGEGISVGQSAMVAYAAGKHVDAASRLIAFLTSKESMARLSAYFPPSRTSLLNAETLATSAPNLTEPQLVPIVEALLESGKFVPVAERNAEMTTALNAALDQYVYGADADIASGLTAVCDAVQPTLGG